MKLYLSEKAPNPDRVRLFLREKGALDQVECVEVSIMKGEHKSEAYRSMSPLAQVPTLVLDDGRALTESRAICTYLESIFPEPNLMGRDATERAFIEMWDRRVELLYMSNIAGWFRNGHSAMAELAAPQSAEWAAISAERAKSMAKWLDGALAKTPFVAGDRFTIADITLHISLGFGRLMKFQPWTDLPNLATWRERMLARPGLA